ncbi:NADH-quinone oxidoreductase subunit 5 family protein [Marinimicrobium koreense]|jgi:NADH-quinone oxidoreductase subunit L|uniref:NADH-quinone oxidoreductase subunit 5 family protein n=1 Tax=Marinimicrobium koreense TaxID=306545 RepID=UPI003F700535
MSDLVLPIVFPLLAAATILLLRRGAAILALVGVALSLAASLKLLRAIASGDSATLLLPGLPELPLRLAAEPLAALFSVVVASVATCVLIYSVGYMKRESGLPRFFALMSLFVAAMQALVLAGDWILVLVAWELVGLCSYLLIGFWFQRPEAANAASRAFLYTRSADLGLYIAIFILIGAAGTSEIAATLNVDGGTAVAAGLLLLLAAMGKSAQVPLQDWLMRAMAGPTPVSALLHSATLVAAGAILLIRVAPLLAPNVLLAIGLVGGITTVAAGLIALAERDLKRLLAASTASQYGLMLIAVGAGVPLAALLHLLAHAAIKSGLFLATGEFQHARGGTALRCLRGVGRDRRWTFLGFALAAMALVGAPPLSGFFSKDAVIAAALSAPSTAWLAPLALAGTLLTGAYLARALRMLWLEREEGESESRPVAGARWMGVGVWALVIPAVFLGLTFGPIEALLGLPGPEAHGTTAMLFGLLAAVVGLALGWLVPAPRLLGPFHPWAQSGLVIAGGLTFWIGRPAMAIAYGCQRLERGLYATVLSVGRGGLFIARGCGRVERGLYAAVLGTGRASLAVAHLVRVGDERRIDGLIFSLVAGVRGWGDRARSLQSGWIHHSLAISAVVTAVTLIILLSASLSF